MTKSLISTILAVSLGFTITAGGEENKLDQLSRVQLFAPHFERTDLNPLPTRLKAVQRVSDLGDDAYVMAFVTLKDGASIDDLQAEGIDVITSRGRVAVISLPKSDVARVCESDAVSRMQLQRPVFATMDVARSASRVDAVMSGLDLPQSYTGAGVVAGIVDGGFDPNHVNFRNADGYSRINYLVVNTVNSASKVESAWYTDDPNAVNWSKSVGYAGTLIDFTTDNTETTHGTHTLGTMAGNYRGPVTRATASSTFASTVENINECPWYGIAPDANIFAVAGSTTDAVIAQGIGQIADYADQMGMPAVINLSLGSNLGPHDGSSPICEYMDAMAETPGYTPITFCIASGNEGDMPIAVKKTLTEEDNTVKTGLNPYLTASSDYYESGYMFYRNAYLSIYSDDETPFDVSVVIFNSKRPNSTSYLATMPIVGSETSSEALYVTDTSVQEQVGGKFANGEAFGKYYTGMVYLSNGVDNGKYATTIFVNAYKKVENNAYVDETDQYAMGVVITGKDGQKISMYTDAITVSFDDYDRSGWVNGSSDGSVSDMATGHKTIVVGSYNTTNIFGCLDGSAPFNETATFPLGEVSAFTSYGTLDDGRTLPTVCAPGAYVISSTSQYYVEDASNYVEEKDVQGIYVESDTRRHYWQAFAGTSMSCPYVSGAIALWLEANPDLTPTEIQEIIAQTSVKDDDVAKGNPVQWGAGKFDAYAGMKEALRRSGVQDITVDSRRPLITTDGYKAFRVFAAGKDKVAATLYDTQGRLVGNYSADGDELRIDASSLPSGVYIFNIDGFTESQRILVK